MSDRDSSLQPSPRRAQGARGLCHTYSFVLDQVVPDRGAAVVLLDDVHLDGVAILSYVTFQLGGAGFPCNNGAIRVIGEKKGIIKEKVLVKIQNNTSSSSAHDELTQTQRTPCV